MPNWSKYNKDLYKIEQAFLEYEFLSDEEKRNIRIEIQKNRQAREEINKIVEQEKEKVCKIYINDAINIIKTKRNITIQALMSYLNIGRNSAEYLIDELINRQIIEDKHGIYSLIEK